MLSWGSGGRLLGQALTLLLLGQGETEEGSGPQGGTLGASLGEGAIYLSVWRTFNILTTVLVYP